MTGNLIEHATEFAISIDSYSVKLNKRSDTVKTHYYLDHTEYTHLKVVDRPDYHPIPEDATILYCNERGAGKWQVTIQNERTHGFVTDDGGFIDWACRIMHQFDRILVNSCVFETPEEALVGAQQVIDKLSGMERDDINELSKETIKEARCKFEIEGYALPVPPEDNMDDIELVDDEESESTFFFVAHGDREKTTVTVIDLHHSVNYERDEFAVIDDVNFRTAPAAIKYAKEVAKLNGLKYQPFESRYYSKFQEVN